MNHLKVLAILLIMSPVNFNAQENLADELVGEWTIDLRPTPASDGYYQVFVVESVADQSFIGTFYGSSLENALINENWDKLYFAFTTKDQNSEYYHSGYLLDGKLFGFTYCPNRELAAPWTGKKK